MISCCIVSYGTVDQYSDLGAAAFSFHMELFCIEQVVYGCLLSLCATFLLFWLELKIESQPLMLLILKALQFDLVHLLQCSECHEQITKVDCILLW